MSTEQLIRALSADAPNRMPPLRVQIAVALAVAIAAGAGLFLFLLGPRPDIAAAAGTIRFIFKFVVTLALVMAAVALLPRLARPGAARGRSAFALVIGPAVLAIGVLLELLSVPGSAWWGRLVGTNSLLCLTSIPLLAAPALLTLFVALRQGAPTEPALAGAVAGLLAGSLGATLYAAHCVDDSPLFVAAWYGLAIALVTGFGALIGRWMLRW